MKRLLPVLACLAALSAGAQSTYNFFDPADCDADGWLWFDSQEKIDKYVGFGNKYKLQLQSSTFEDSDGQFAEPWADPEIAGYNAEGVQGGDGSWKGAIVLTPCQNSLGSDSPNGGGILFQLPDCADISMAFSIAESPMCVGLSGAKGWVDAIDCGLIRTYLKMGILVNRPLATTTQFTWNSVQDITNDNTGLSLASPAGEKVTGMVRNNRGEDLLVHGLRIFTYTDLNSSSVEGVASDNISISRNGNIVEAYGADLEVYSLTGSKVAFGHSALDISGLGKGLYVVKATAGNDTAVKKITR